MRAGRLRHTVDIQKPIETRSATGAVATTYITKLSGYMCIVNELSGQELERAQRIDPDVSVTITGRYLANIYPKDRALYGGKVVEIVSAINPDSRNIELVLNCKRPL